MVHNCMSLECRSTYIIFNVILYFCIICGNHETNKLNNKLEQLKLWCDGIYINNNIELRHFVIGSGFFAKQDIEPGTTVIQIPIKCCLFEQTIKENTIIINNKHKLYIEPFIYENIFKNDTFSAFGMAMYLLQLTKSKSNPFKPFLVTLPDKPPMTPLSWRQDLIKLIKHTSADRLLTQQIIILNEFLNNFKLRNKLKPFLTELVYIFSIISSRIYTLYSYKGIKDNNKNIFIPVVDQLNHNPLLTNVIFHYNATKNIIQINVVKYINKNKQLFLNYGSKSNSMLLSQYGFILKNNLYQFTDNDLYININDINYQKKRNLLHLFPSYLTSNLRFGNHGLQLKSAKSYYISSLQENNFNLFTIATIMAVKPFNNQNKNNKVIIVDELRRISLAIHNSVNNFTDIELENDLRFALCENGKRLNNVLNKQYDIVQTIECNSDENHMHECFTINMIETYLNEEIKRLRNANTMYCLYYH